MKKYLFIDNFDTKLIDKQDRNTSIIFRNYKIVIKESLILDLKNFCKKRKINFYLSNNVKLAIKLDLDGAYIPSFNKSFKHLAYSFKSNFILLGSAHTNEQIKTKEKQKIQVVFISSLFKRNKNYLGINKFKLISEKTIKKIVVLGGISKNNLNKLRLLNCFGFAGISYFKEKKGP